MRRTAPALILAVLTTAGCTLNTDYFAEYRGRNLLGNYDFDAAGKWTIGTTLPVFLTWEAATADAAINSYGTAYTTGPDGSSPAYHLEIKNLITNGDFEGTAPGALSGAYWAIDTDGVATVGTYAPFSGQSLEWKSNIGGKLILKLKDALPSAAAWNDLRYRIRADYMPTSNVFTAYFALMGSGPTPVTSWNPAVSQSTLTNFDENIQLDTTATPDLWWWIGQPNNQSTQELVLDNLRMLPDEGNLSTTASLPSLSSGVLKLLPGSKSGMYQLTLYVRDDPSTLAAGATDPDLVRNRFRATNLTVSTTAWTKGGNKTYATVFARTAGWATGWTKLTMNFGFDFVDSDADLAGNKAMTVSLSPTENGTGSVDVGSLLVAQPSLTFNP